MNTLNDLSKLEPYSSEWTTALLWHIRNLEDRMTIVQNEYQTLEMERRYIDPTRCNQALELLRKVVAIYHTTRTSEELAEELGDVVKNARLLLARQSPPS